MLLEDKIKEEDGKRLKKKKWTSRKKLLHKYTKNKKRQIQIQRRAMLQILILKNFFRDRTFHKENQYLNQRQV
jgi:hypothetical protein